MCVKVVLIVEDSDNSCHVSFVLDSCPPCMCWQETWDAHTGS